MVNGLASRGLGWSLGHVQRGRGGPRLVSSPEEGVQRSPAPDQRGPLCSVRNCDGPLAPPVPCQAQ